jgi:hypothetical protein
MKYTQSVSNATPLDTWLKWLGFHQGNPFATNEADRERTLLPDFFVDVESYDLIKGEQTAIVFSPRGGGKSSLRVILASYGAPWDPRSATLAVECTDFDSLISRWQKQQPLTIAEYVEWLLPAGVRALFGTFFHDVQPHAVSTHSDHANRMRRSAQLTPPVRAHFARLLRAHCPSLLSMETVGRLLSRYLPEHDSFDWLQFGRAVRNNQLRGYVAEHALIDQELITLLADLNDFSMLTTAAPTGSPSALLADFVSLVRDAGFANVYFLLDRLDETVETADNPQAQADILEPLLAHLPVLEMPGAAFKFFLSREARDVLWERPTVRQEDRLAEYAVTLRWDDTKLKDILTRRLSAYSVDPATGVPAVTDLAAICAETVGKSETTGKKQKTNAIGKKIEEGMIARAQGSPRRLIIAGRLLFEVHLQRKGDSGWLEWEDWLQAEQELLHKFPPLLRIHPDEKCVSLGHKTIDLTRNEEKIVAALVQAGGKCSRDQLATAVWGSLATGNEAMDQAISRLRSKLNDNAQAPIYLRTIPGQGFELLNYELS